MDRKNATKKRTAVSERRRDASTPSEHSRASAGTQKKRNESCMKKQLIHRGIALRSVERVESQLRTDQLLRRGMHYSTPPAAHHGKTVQDTHAHDASRPALEQSTEHKSPMPDLESRESGGPTPTGTLNHRSTDVTTKAFRVSRRPMGTSL